MLPPNEKEDKIQRDNCVSSYADKFIEEDCKQILDEYYKKTKKQIELISVFSFERDQDLETTIIQSLLKCKFSMFIII
jgi:hypothetical protein